MTAVVPEHVYGGEEENDLVIRPGGDPPFVVPWCASCKDSVETFTVDPLSNPFRMGIQASCHGATQGIWITVDDLFRRKAKGAPVVMFKRTAFNGVR